MLYITYVCPNEGMKLGTWCLSVAARPQFLDFIIGLFSFAVCHISIISPQITVFVCFFSP